MISNDVTSDDTDLSLADTILEKEAYSEIEQPFFQRKSTKIGIFIGGGILFSLWLIYFLFFATIEKQVIVTDLQWERIVKIEDERTVTEEGWSVPYGGRELDNWTAQSGTKEVFSHYETVSYSCQTGTESYSCGYSDNGNGTFSPNTCTRPVYGTCTRQESRYRTEPVYDTRYKYEIERWFHNRDRRTYDDIGDGLLDQPYWYDYRLGSRERVGKTSESYLVVMITQDEEKKVYTKSFSQSEWSQYKLGDFFVLLTNRVGWRKEIKE